MSASPLKHALEDLLKARRLHPEVASVRGTGEDRPLRALETGSPTINALARGGFPRGEISELYGPPSSGRTAVALSAVACATREGALTAWIDPADQLDPASAAATGVELDRLLWIRGPRGVGLKRSLTATSTLLGSGLFDLVVLDMLALPDRERRALPGTTWVRLHRMIEGTPTALLLLSTVSVARSSWGVSLQLQTPQPGWTGPPTGPGRLLARLAGEAGKRHGPRVAFTRQVEEPPRHLRIPN